MTIPEIIAKYKVIEPNLEIIESVYPSNGRNGGGGNSRGSNRGGSGSRNSSNSNNAGTSDKKP